MNAPELQAIPDVRGLEAKEAEARITAAGFRAQSKRAWRRDLPGEEEIQPGAVAQTVPPAGSQVPTGSLVLLETKVDLRRTVILGLAGLAVLAGIVALILALRPEPIVQEPPKPPEGPDPSKAVKPGAKERPGGILVYPTLNKQSVSVGSKLTTVNVINKSTKDDTLYFYYVPLTGNSLTGQPEYRISPETIAEGKKYIKLDREKQPLKPGEQTTISGTIIRQPEGKPEMYGALVVEFDRDRTTKESEEIKGGVRVKFNNIYRITATQILSFAPGSADIKPLQVRGVQEEEGIQFLIRARNQGNALGRPDGGNVAIVNQAGRTVFQENITTSQGILPNNLRDLRLNDRPLIRGLEPGQYRAIASVRSGSKRRAVEWSFRIARDGRLPTPAARFASAARPYAPKEEESFSIVVEAENNGTKTYTPTADISIVPYGKSNVLQKQSLELGEVDVGQRTRASAQFKGISKQGNYEAIVQLRSEDNIYLGQSVASILVGGDRPDASASIRDWMSAHPIETLLLGVALVGIFVLLGYFIYRFFSKRKVG